MARSTRLEKKLDELIKLDTRTKELIGFIEQLAVDAGEVGHLRTQLDLYQDEVKGYISTMGAILDELQQSKQGSWPGSAASNMRLSAAYNREQLSTLQDSYRKAIFKATRQIETLERSQLVNKPTGRRQADSGAERINEVYENSLELTRDMVACARRLADEVKLGALNAQLLEDSSNQIGSNYAELKDTTGKVSQSVRLTSLARRRRLTSYVLYSLAFAFFFLSAAKIFLHRVPFGSSLLPSFL
ncbi:unnamed protein product [Calicophoron daubneyi]|uniref:Sec20 C-terminal domain-containing protein n=1 Tax=Calicophoron daubneyi TaxID=300641 RepID=A0AAV2TBL0_CALDB